MSDVVAFAKLGGKAVAKLTLTAGAVGAWFADIDLEDDSELPSGIIALECQGGTLSGTIDPEKSGVFGLQRKVRLVGGANGWQTVVKSQAFTNDVGVNAKTVADATAKLVGETLGDFMPGVATFAANWVRERESAGSTLERLAGDVPYWVDYSGITHVRARPLTPAPTGSYEVLEYDVRHKRATLAIDDLHTIRPGSVLTDRLEEAKTVQEIEITLTGSELRATVQLGTDYREPDLLERAVESVVGFFISRELHGKYRYRVVSMADDGRVNLQAVRKNGRVPDALLVPQWGAPGIHAKLQEGALVAVCFLEGDRQLPVIDAYQGIQGGAWIPHSVTIGGLDGAVDVAFKGASCEMIFPPMVLTGTALIGGIPSPITAVGFTPAGKFIGQVTSGTPAVKVGFGQ